MSKTQSLQDEIGHLQKILAAKNTLIENLGIEIKKKDDELIKLTERNTVLKSANEDLKAMQEKP